MKYGLIGEHLGHSFSKEVHAQIAEYDYEIREIEKDKLAEFMREHDFNAINVTIPYKQDVIPYLNYISEEAKAINAVNTIVNRDGKLYGYNTDFYGMCALISYAGVSLSGKKVLILGTGGTSKTAKAVAKHLGANQIITVSRRSTDGCVTYEEMYESHTDANVIINTTPVGMYPNNDGCPVDITKFDSLSGVIDAIYNPLRTKLVRNAKKRGIPAEGGLYMLVAQAVRASEIFLDTTYPEEILNKVYKKILCEKESIVLIGMPASGKSTVGRILSKQLSRELVDTDHLIVRRVQRVIPEIFKNEGEAKFREYERREIAEIAILNGLIIATGGGSILKEENVDNLKQNGRLFFIDRPPEKLVPTSDRPLSSDRDAILKRYNERYDIYCHAADEIIDADNTAQEVAEKIIGGFYK